MAVVHAAWRLLRALAHALAGLATILFVFPRLQQPERNARVQAWAARMLAIVGIELQVRGTPPERGPMLLVANHISWLDILALHAARHCRFVSKSQVRRWPLVGPLATGAGTLYVERESRRDAMRVVHGMAASLRAGDILAIFPEGTTTDGAGLLPFHANLLQAAISADAPVLPVGLDFLEAGTRHRSRAAAYIDDDTLLGSVWRALMAPPLLALVTFGEPQHAGGRDRRQWAVDLRTAVQQLRETSVA